MIANVLLVIGGVFTLFGVAVVCMVLACAFIDRGPVLPIPDFPQPAVVDLDDADPDLVDLLQNDERRVQREVVFAELNAWFALPAAVNR